MKKEQILENSYNTYFTDSKYHDSPDKNFTEIYVLPAMDDFAKQEAIEFNIWKSTKGWYAQGFTQHTTHDTPCWIRQENQLVFSNPISSNKLWELYLQSKQK